MRFAFFFLAVCVLPVEIGIFLFCFSLGWREVIVVVASLQCRVWQASPWMQDEVQSFPWARVGQPSLRFDKRYILTVYHQNVLDKTARRTSS